MSDIQPSTRPVEAAFADAANAEYAAAQLQEHGIPAERIDIEHGAAEPGQLDAVRRIVREKGGTLW